MEIAMDEKKKRNLKKKALEGAASETIQRYGEAVKEHVVAYKGDPIKIKQRNIADAAKSWKLRRGKCNDSYRRLHKSYKNNLKQGAGFAAEIKAVAKENAENIINGDKKRVARTDEINKQGYRNGNAIGGTNDPLYDVVEIDTNGKVVAGTAKQLKFVESNGKDCAYELLKDDYDKYRNNNDR